MLEQFLGCAAIAAAQDQRLARRRVGQGSGVDQGLVVEEFLAFGGHEAAIQSQHLAELRRVQQLQLLMARLHGFAPRGAPAKARMGRERLQRPIALIGRRRGLGAGTDVAAHQMLAHHAARRVGGDHALHQRAGLARVVGGEVADVDIDGDAAGLGPGVYGQVRFGQQHGAGDAAGLPLVVRELDPAVLHQGQAGLRGLCAAQGGDGIGVEHMALVALALVEIGGQVQSVHVACFLLVCGRIAARMAKQTTLAKT